MKKLMFTLVGVLTLFMLHISTYAQQKVKDGTVTGTSSLPHPGAIQELESNNKGQLLPRVALSSTTVWGLAGTQVAGMIVYNTRNTIVAGSKNYPINPGNLASTKGTGTYYWDGNGWVATEQISNPIVAAFQSSTTHAATNNAWWAVRDYSELKDTYNQFDPVGGTFRAPVSGVYSFHVTADAYFNNNTTNVTQLIFRAFMLPPGGSSWDGVPNPTNPATTTAAAFLFPKTAENNPSGNFYQGNPFSVSFVRHITMAAGALVHFQALTYGNTGVLNRVGISNFEVQLTSW